MCNILEELVEEEKKYNKITKIENENDKESEEMNIMHQKMKQRDGSNKTKEQSLREKFNIETMHGDILVSLASSLNKDHAQSQSEAQAKNRETKHDIVEKNKEI